MTTAGLIGLRPPIRLVGGFLRPSVDRSQYVFPAVADLSTLALQVDLSSLALQIDVNVDLDPVANVVGSAVGSF
ncbi:hypothetical protein ACFQL4_24215 [Halosimplex aquaticum]